MKFTTLMLSFLRLWRTGNRCRQNFYRHTRCNTYVHTQGHRKFPFGNSRE